VHKTTDTNKTDKMGEATRAMSWTTQETSHTAMDYALKAQEINTELLRRTSQAWIEGFRFQARLSQGMAQAFFGQWGNAFASTTHVERPAREQSRSEVTEPATNGAQKDTEPSAEDARKNTEVAAEDARQKAEKQKAEKQKAEKQKAEKQKAEKQRAEKVATETRKAEEAAEETQEATETAAKSAQKSTEPAAEETQKSTEVAAKDAQETQKSTEIAAEDAEKAAFPIDGYDEMNEGEVSERLGGLSAEELKRVRKYEKRNKDRGSLRKEMKQKIETAS
jgi:type IV secretory pathway VirB10-like protein